MQTLSTARLVLRPFEVTDAAVVEALAGDAEVARTSNVPHPYPAGSARAWITAEHDVGEERAHLALRSRARRRRSAVVAVGTYQ